MENVNNSPSSQPTHISKLPEEVLMEIFGLLRGNKANSDLINATQVCKNWNQIITSPRFARFIVLKVDLRTIEVDEEFTLTRQYRHAVVQDDLFDPERSWEEEKIGQVLEALASLKNLTTVELVGVKVSKDSIRELSQCQALRLLIFKDCIPIKCEQLSHNRDLYEFNNLKIMRLDNGSAALNALHNYPYQLGLRYDPTYMLNFIRCKELDSFTTKSVFDSGSQFSVSYFNGFLNQLDRCDEIEAKICYINGGSVKLKPKFLWRKLTLDVASFFLNPPEQKQFDAMIGKLCGASWSNAECDIKLTGLDGQEENLMLAIFNNCRTISCLTLRSLERLPELTRMRNLPELQRFKTDGDCLQTRNFPELARKLVNVNDVTINYDHLQDLDFTLESVPMLQPFFNQITVLNLNSVREEGFYELRHWPLEFPVRFFEIRFEILRTLTVTFDGRFGTFSLTELFVNFCNGNRNLRHLIVHVNDLARINADTRIDWRAGLIQTFIETCDIKIKTNNEFINWRAAEVDGVSLFGRVLTDEENQFYI